MVHISGLSCEPVEFIVYPGRTDVETLTACAEAVRRKVRGLMARGLILLADRTGEPPNRRHSCGNKIHCVLIRTGRGVRMRRRDALLLLCSAAVPLDVPVMAQTSGPVQRIGWVGRGSSWDWSEVAVLLRPLGWTRGGNLRADVRVAVTPAELPTIAREVVEARPIFHRHQWDTGDRCGPRRDAEHPGDLLRDCRSNRQWRCR